MGNHSGIAGSILRLACVGVLMLASGCATSAPLPQSAQPTPPMPQAAKVPQSEVAVPVEAEADQAQMLENLWKTRTAEVSKGASDSEFAFGPGDVLRISVPQIPDLKDRTVRVSEQDTIALPLLGVINVTGMTEQDLLNDLSRRAAKYLYHPQVEVFIQQTESRQVAVLGSVKTPGRYMLSSPSDTIMTMVGRAGGMTDEAASRIILVPAPASGRADTGGSAATMGRGNDPAEGASHAGAGVSRVSLGQSANPDDLANRAHSIRLVISTSRAEDQRYLEIPARPGDVIIVPAAGEVTVQGWVDKPGSFKITPGMTVLSSIGAAGGALFSDSVTLLRENGNGVKVEQSLDLAKLKGGSERDIPLQGGDVVVVERSALGAVPYSLYFIVNKVGIGLPMMIP